MSYISPIPSDALESKTKWKKWTQQDTEATHPDSTVQVLLVWQKDAHLSFLRRPHGHKSFSLSQVSYIYIYISSSCPPTSQNTTRQPSSLTWRVMTSDSCWRKKKRRASNPHIAEAATRDSILVVEIYFQRLTQNTQKGLRDKNKNTWSKSWGVGGPAYFSFFLSIGWI